MLSLRFVTIGKREQDVKQASDAKKLIGTALLRRSFSTISDPQNFKIDGNCEQ